MKKSDLQKIIREEIAVSQIREMESSVDSKLLGALKKIIINIGTDLEMKGYAKEDIDEFFKILSRSNGASYLR